LSLGQDYAQHSPANAAKDESCGSAQYKYAKLGAVAMSRMDGKDFATLLEKAIERSGKERELKLIEATSD